MKLVLFTLVFPGLAKQTKDTEKRQRKNFLGKGSHPVHLPVYESNPASDFLFWFCVCCLLEPSCLSLENTPHAHNYSLLAGARHRSLSAIHTNCHRTGTAMPCAPQAKQTDSMLQNKHIRCMGFKNKSTKSQTEQKSQGEKAVRGELHAGPGTQRTGLPRS